MSTTTPTKPAQAPGRSFVQRMNALAKANEVRKRRGELRRDLKANRVSIASIVDGPPEYLETMNVSDLLLAVPRFGPAKTKKALVKCRISPSKTVGGMSPRQRRELAEILRDH